eukprot:448601-Prorocentrum_lima.AAC.1
MKQLYTEKDEAEILSKRLKKEVFQQSIAVKRCCSDMDLPPELITVWNGFSSGETRLLFLSFDFLVRTLKDRDSLLRSRQ